MKSVKSSGQSWRLGQSYTVADGTSAFSLAWTMGTEHACATAGPAHPETAVDVGPSPRDRGRADLPSDTPLPFLGARRGVGLNSILGLSDLVSSLVVSDMTRASGDLLDSCRDSSKALSPRGKGSPALLELQAPLGALGGARRKLFAALAAELGGNRCADVDATLVVVVDAGGTAAVVATTAVGATTTSGASSTDSAPAEASETASPPPDDDGAALSAVALPSIASLR